MDSNLEIWSSEMLGVIISETDFPPLHQSEEVGGQTIKTYPFIIGHRKLKKYDLAEIEAPGGNHASMVNRSEELEEKLELRYKNCCNLFGSMKTNINLWLPQQAGNIFLLDEKNTKKVNWFAQSIKTMLNGIIPNGAERHRLVETLEKNDMCSGRVSFKKEFDESIFEDLKTYNRSLIPLVDTDSDKEVELDMQELLDYVGALLSKMESVISESVDLYYEYINIESKLGGFDGEAFITSLSAD